MATHHGAFARLLAGTAAGLTVSACGLLSLPDERLWPGQGQQAEKKHFAYMYVGRATGSLEPCLRIPPDVYSVAPFNPVGRQVSLVRSSCMKGAAANTNRPALCDEVVSVSTILYSGSELDADQCRREAPENSSVGGSPSPIGDFLRTLGYEEPFRCRPVRTTTLWVIPSVGVVPGTTESEPEESDPETCAFDVWLEETSSGRILEHLDRIEDWR